ncbi:MAG: PQQ-binding-like beta-propeller repeat protein [Planctomycetales bacterium]|nr:PQQ-binding-like beta-propeller repeat protein [Planctomycetales bacterium]
MQFKYKYLLVYISSLLLSCLLTTCVSSGDWTQFRGPGGSGAATAEHCPTAWSSSENLAWQVDLPGRGISSPIVVAGRVLITACSGIQQDRLHVLCFDQHSGNLLWERQFWATGRTQTHQKINTAAPTPVSDGQSVYALFSTNDLFALDLEGHLLWLRGLSAEYPNANNSLGMASSPIVADGSLIVMLETDSQAVALGIDCQSGGTRWELDRPRIANWSSPTLLRGSEGQAIVALQSSRGLSAHDPKTGTQLWNFDRGCDTRPTGVSSGEVAYVPSNGLVALRGNDLSGTPDILWESNRLQPSTASPLLSGARLYVINRSILKCADTATGKVVWQLRIEGDFTSSPVAAGKHIYVFNEAGVGQVIEDEGDSGRVVGGGDLKEIFICTPAIADDAIFIRSDQHLFKIAAAPE